MHPTRSSALVLALSLPVVAGCGGGKSQAEKSMDAAVSAKAACGVFVNFPAAAGTDTQSQIDYVKATYGAFLKAADLAATAAADDPRWKPLQSAADREAAAYGVIARATKGVDPAEVAGVNKAVAEAKAARPLFIAECVKADPKNFTPVPTPTATPSESPEPKGSKNV